MCWSHLILKPRVKYILGLILCSLRGKLIRAEHSAPFRSHSSSNITIWLRSSISRGTYVPFATDRLTERIEKTAIRMNLNNPSARIAFFILSDLSLTSVHCHSLPYVPLPQILPRSGCNLVELSRVYARDIIS